MPQQDDHMKYRVDPELIRRYLAGELDDRAMHALERQAMDDPMLAEALEGFENVSPDQSVHLADLEQRLEERIQKRTRSIIPLYIRWTAAAAALLFLVVGTLWLWLPDRDQHNLADIKTVKKDTVTGIITDDSGHALADKINEKPQTMRKKQASEPAPATQPATTPAGPAPAAEALSRSAVTPAAAPVASAPVPPTPKATMPDTSAENPSGKVLPPVAADQLKEVPMRAMAKKIQSPPAVSFDTISNANADQAKALSGRLAGVQTSQELNKKKTSVVTGNEFGHTIRGRVTDDKGHSIPFASITWENGKTGVLTDTGGYFQLKTEKPPDWISAGSIGYESKRQQVKGDTDNLLITMKPFSNALSENIVTGYAKQSDEESVPPSVTPPTPVDGYKSFNRYIAANLKYPESAAKDKIKGRVKVSFTVGGNGMLSDFKILKKLQADCDAEAIRVIKEGPGWKPASDNQPHRVKVVVYFRK